MTKRIKFIFIFTLAVIAVLITNVSYSYWAGSVGLPESQNKDITLGSGSANQVSTTISLNDPTITTKRLVPPNKALLADDPNSSVEVIEVIYDVFWVNTSNQVNASDNVLGTLTVTRGTILVGSNSSLGSNFNVVITISNSTMVLNGPKATVTVRITLNDINVSTYMQISDYYVTIPLTFKVNVQG